MGTAQELRQASVRAVTGTAYTYEEDWHALFDLDGIVAGHYNDRLLAWINTRLTTSFQNINDAMLAFAQDQGFGSWSQMGTFEASSGAGPTDGRLLEDGTSYRLLESGDFRLQESA